MYSWYVFPREQNIAKMAVIKLRKFITDLVCQLHKVLLSMHTFFITPTPTLVAFIGVNSAHGPSPSRLVSKNVQCISFSDTLFHGSIFRTFVLVVERVNIQLPTFNVFESCAIYRNRSCHFSFLGGLLCKCQTSFFGLIWVLLFHQERWVGQRNWHYIKNW